MKKLLLVLFLMCCLTSLFADVKAIVNLKPYFYFDKSPIGADSSEDHLVWKDLQSDDWWEIPQDYLLREYQRPSFLDVGFEMDSERFKLVLILDIRQDLLQNLWDDGSIMTNIPFVGATIDMNFPRVGYIDYTSESGNFYASLGRRQIKWGPATYNMAISDSQPYLDNLYVEINAPMKNGWNFCYGFTGIAYKYFLNYGGVLVDNGHSERSYIEDGPKSTFAHKFGFENDYFRISLAELNNIYGKQASILDFGPTTIWHNGYQDEYSNVMLELEVEASVGPVRAFGTFTMDDFDLPHEVDDDYGLSNKPQAMGFSAGIELNLLDGEPIESSEFDYWDYALKEDTFKKDKGLNIGYEFYYCSTFMYNRVVNGGKFTVPFQFISFAAGEFNTQQDGFFLGFPYGPSSLVHRLYAEYTNNPFKAYASAELIKRGSYLIDGPYGDNSVYYSMGLKTMELTAPITTALKVTVGLDYYLDDGFKANAEFGLSKDLTHGTQAYSGKVGASIALCDVDWKSIF